MNVVISSGGSGGRVLEALIHLCAAGLGPESIGVIRLEPDTSNGCAARVEKLLQAYDRCHKIVGQAGEGPFHTQIEVFAPTAGAGNFGCWSPVKPKETLRGLLNYNILKSRERDVVHLLYSEDELDMRLDEGFRGHTSIGAAAFAQLSATTVDPLWARLVGGLRTATSQRGAHVVLVGSVFGGTGASSFHPVLRFLRQIPQQNHDKLHVGLVALAPYFSFEAPAAPDDPAQRLAAQAAWFPLATRSAAAFYHHLKENNDWDVDEMFWVGDSRLAKVEYAPGGIKQVNPPHFVDLLGALACLESLRAEHSSRGIYYSGPAQQEPAKGGGAPLEWTDVPVLRLDASAIKQVTLTLLLAGMAHTTFFGPLLNKLGSDADSYRIPWYYDRFVGHGGSLKRAEAQQQMDHFTQFLEEHHFPWWRDVHATDGARLFNQSAIPNQKGEGDSSPIARLLWPDRAPGGGSPIHALFDEVIRVAAKTPGEPNTATWLTILFSASRSYSTRAYSTQVMKGGAR